MGELKIHRQLLIITFLLFAALTISHVAYSLFAMVAAFAVYLSKMLLRRGELKSAFIIFFFVTYFTWYILLDLFPCGYLMRYAMSLKNLLDVGG